MGMGYGFGQMVQGMSRGLDDIERRQQEEEDRQYLLKRRQRDDTQWEQGQEDRRYRLQRQRITDQRQDQQYRVAKEQQDFIRSFDNAMRRYAFTNGADYSGLVDLYNNEFHDGYTINARRDRKGQYSVEFLDRDGRLVGKKDGLTFDQFGELAISMRDPQKWLEAKQQAMAKEEDRDFELRKLREEYRLKGDLEKTKAQYSGGKDGGLGLGSAASKEMRQIVGQGLTTLRSTYGGRLDGGMWFPDEANKDEASIAYALMEQRIRQGEQNGQAAALAARMEARSVVQAADEQLRREGFDPAELDDAGEERRSELILSFGSQLLQGGQAPGAGTKTAKPRASSRRKAPTWNEFLATAMKYGRRDGVPDEEIRTKARALYEKKFGSTGEPSQEFINWLKDHDTPENRASFDKRFGEGAAEKALGKEFSLVRKAGAAVKGVVDSIFSDEDEAPSEPLMYNGKPLIDPDERQTGLSKRVDELIEAFKAQNSQQAAKYRAGQEKLYNAALRRIRRRLKKGYVPKSKEDLVLALSSSRITKQEKVLLKKLFENTLLLH